MGGFKIPEETVGCRHSPRNIGASQQSPIIASRSRSATYIVSVAGVAASAMEPFVPMNTSRMRNRAYAMYPGALRCGIPSSSRNTQSKLWPAPAL